MMRLYN